MELSWVGIGGISSPKLGLFTLLSGQSSAIRAVKSVLWMEPGIWRSSGEGKLFSG